MQKIIKKHIFENIKCYIVICIFFLTGVVLGAYVSAKYSAGDADGIKDFLNSSVTLLKNNSPCLSDVFTTSLKSGIKTAVLVWFLGFTVIGDAVILFILLKNGFMMGFAVSFIIGEFSFSGIPGAVILILFKCLVFLPSLFFLSCLAMRVSSAVFSLITGKVRYRTDFRRFILRYTLCFLGVLVCVLIYSAGEAYIGSNLLKLYLNFS